MTHTKFALSITSLFLASQELSVYITLLIQALISSLWWAVTSQPDLSKHLHVNSGLVLFWKLTKSPDFIDLFTNVLTMLYNQIDQVSDLAKHFSL